MSTSLNELKLARNQKLFLNFPLRVRPLRIMMDTHYCHFQPSVMTNAEIFPNGLFEIFRLSINDRALVVDCSAGNNPFSPTYCNLVLSLKQLYLSSAVKMNMLEQTGDLRRRPK